MFDWVECIDGGAFVFLLRFRPTSSGIVSYLGVAALFISFTRLTASNGSFFLCFDDVQSPPTV
jgi:hypothetical protein